MKEIVVYTSGTGFTEQYAKWISQELECDCVPLKKVSVQNLSSYDKVIYGGWVFGGMVMGLNKILSCGIKPVAVFAVGATPAGTEGVEQQIRKANTLSEEIPLFYMEAGFNYDRLGFFKKFILKMLLKSLEKKESRSENEEIMLSALKNGSDNSSKEQTEPLVNLVRNSN